MGVAAMTTPRIRSWAVTHPGTKRTHNEDAYVDRPDLGIWAVADGAGGHAAGEVASGMIASALQAIPSGLSASELLAQVRIAMGNTHTALREEAARRGPDVLVASTVVVMLARGDHFACLWAGDLRAYCCAAARCARSPETTAWCRNCSRRVRSVRTRRSPSAEQRDHPRGGC